MEHDQLATTAEPEEHTVGSILCRCREFNSISLEEAAEATKIGKTYLRALEEDRFQDLPSPAYLKGFLRTYAAYLGLQSEELIQLATRQESDLPAEPVKAEQARLAAVGFNWQRLLLPAVLLVALIVSALFVVPSPPKRTLPPPPQPQPSVAVQPALSSIRGVPAVNLEPQESAVEKPSEPIAPPKKPLDGFMVRMKVNRNSSLSVTIDDAASQGYDLTSGDLIEWKAARTIALDLTDAASVEIELNGTPLKLQVSPGKPAYIVLDAQGIKQ